MKYFLWSFCPFSCFKKGSCLFLVNECAKEPVNHFETKSAQKKVYLGNHTRHDLNSVDWVIKVQTS